jgi:hypothetical protein
MASPCAATGSAPPPGYASGMRARWVRRARQPELSFLGVLRQKKQRATAGQRSLPSRRKLHVASCMPRCARGHTPSTLRRAAHTTHPRRRALRALILTHALAVCVASIRRPRRRAREKSSVHHARDLGFPASAAPLRATFCHYLSHDAIHAQPICSFGLMSAPRQRAIQRREPLRSPGIIYCRPHPHRHSRRLQSNAS